jgi:hypothetical protein
MLLNEVATILAHQRKMLVLKNQNRYLTFASIMTNALSIYWLADCLFLFHVPQVIKLLSWWWIEDDRPIFQHNKRNNKNKR